MRDIASLQAFGSSDWEQLVREARSRNLLARIGWVARESGILQSLPGAPRGHLESALILASAQREQVRREVDEIRRALAPLAIDVVLLKGAAYVMAALPAGDGRLFSDIDILVPRVELPKVESQLMKCGWATTHLHPYDQRYYRRWMHELPPMRHVRRGTAIDVHHAIVPRTARRQHDPSKLLSDAQPVRGHPGLRTLSPRDMVLHSATHLFVNDDLDNGLRDLLDIDSLLRRFGADAQFWPSLTERAVELHLDRYLYYALRYAERVLDTPVPAEVRRDAARAQPNWIARRLMDTIYSSLLAPRAPSDMRVGTRLATEALLVRAHWLRMPPWLLLYHLPMKLFRGKTNPAEAQQHA